jgi:GTP-dependent dephospho-CoA kinase
VYRLPESMRGEFQRPFGPVVQTSELKKALRPDDVLVCIGDHVSGTAIGLGLKPKLIVVDYKTERHEIADVLRAVVSGYGKTVLRVPNPPATVTNELYAAVAQGLRLSGSVRIEVEGEEDLAGLPVFAEAPEGTVVLYGMPKKGVVVVRVDEAMRRRARGLLERMRAKA